MGALLLPKVASELRWPSASALTSITRTELRSLAPPLPRVRRLTPHTADANLGLDVAAPTPAPVPVPAAATASTERSAAGHEYPTPTPTPTPTPRAEFIELADQSMDTDYQAREQECPTINFHLAHAHPNSVHVGNFNSLELPSKTNTSTSTMTQNSGLNWAAINWLPNWVPKCQSKAVWEEGSISYFERQGTGLAMGWIRRIARSKFAES